MINQPIVTAITTGSFSAIKAPDITGQLVDFVIYAEAGNAFEFNSVNNSAAAAVIPADSSKTFRRVPIEEDGTVLYAKMQTTADNV